MASLRSLSKEQKEAVGLLQVGTFLEYFDLMLYVHMAVLLNELFFPKSDPHTAAVVAAFAFCTTYVMRPFGAMLFGYIGDHAGRKMTVVMTTAMMSISCIIMANVPTYAQIGISAAWVVTICRIVQGLSSMGEIIGAQIYITETIKTRAQYVAVSLIVLASALGTVAALGIATLVTRSCFEWRTAFWIGAGIAVVGSLARTRLRETPEFLEMQRKKQQKEATRDDSGDAHRINASKKNLMYYYFIESIYSLIFYLTFFFFNPILNSFGYSPEDIIYHNFILSLFAIVCHLVVIYFVTFVHPLKILNVRSKFCFLILLLLPFLINSCYVPWHIFCLQCVLLVARGGSTPADTIFIRSIRIDKRFTLVTLNYAVSRAVIQVISAFGLIYLTEWFGYWGLWIIALPLSFAYMSSIRHFEKLEGLRPDKSSNPDLGVEHGKAA